MDKDTEQKKPSSSGYNYSLAIRICGDFGASIAIPALIAAYAGVRLDEHLGTKPWLLALCLIVAFTLTAFYIVRKAKYYAKLYDRN